MPREQTEPFGPSEAKRCIRHILTTGEFRFSSHAEQEMAKDDLSTVDCVNVLRGGVVDPPDLVNGSWRYRVHTDRICVVIAFRSATALSVVTAWRVKERRRAR